MAVPTCIVKRDLVLSIFKRDLILMIFKLVYREVVTKRATILQVFKRPIRPG